MSKKELHELIEQKRMELIKDAALYGIESPAILALSKELDQLMNQYNRLVSQEPDSE